MEKRGIRYAMSDVTNRTLRSSLTRGLTDGRDLEVIIKLRKMGYRRAQFSLRGSREALVQVLGSEPEVLSAALRN